MNPDLKYKIIDDEVTITRCDKGASGKLVIPATIEGKTVTSIGYAGTWDGVFRDCRSLTSITIPDSVTFIGTHAFQDCRNLTSITIPDGVTRIRCATFSLCTSLTSITISDGVTLIGKAAFSSCKNLTSITISESVTSIEAEAFPEANRNILDGYAFQGCRSLTSITIPAGVREIRDSAFCDCTNLTSITIPAGVCKIPPAWEFENCPNLRQLIFLGDAPSEPYFYSEVVPYTIYRRPEAKGWGETWGGRPVKLISEKP